jgi:hypothetical protein
MKSTDEIDAHVRFLVDHRDGLLGRLTGQCGPGDIEARPVELRGRLRVADPKTGLQIASQADHGCDPVAGVAAELVEHVLLGIVFGAGFQSLG